jgi:hypothetical protein
VIARPFEGAGEVVDGAVGRGHSLYPFACRTAACVWTFTKCAR